VCPTSNIATGLYPDPVSHPLLRLCQAGVSLSLNSDDPPYFATSIGREYTAAASAFDLSLDDLMKISRDALAAAFVDAATRTRLLERVAR